MKHPLPEINLPEPNSSGTKPLEECLRGRRSVRSFADASLSFSELSQVLWAVQGEMPPGKRRTAPSAGALYPLEVYVVAGKVSGVPAGIYKYLPHGHRLAPVAAGDRRRSISRGALEQYFIGEAPASVVFCAVFERCTRKYRERGIFYTYMEAGHAAQNLLLQAVALGLGSVPLGAFREREIAGAIECAADEQPIYILPLGRPG